MKYFWKSKRATIICFIVTCCYLLWRQRNDTETENSGSIEAMEPFRIYEQSGVDIGNGQRIYRNMNVIGIRANELLNDRKELNVYDDVNNYNNRNKMKSSKHKENLIKSIKPTKDLRLQQVGYVRSIQDEAVQREEDTKTEFDLDVDISEVISSNVTHVRETGASKFIRDRYESSQPALSQEMIRNLQYRPNKLSQHDFHWTVRTRGQYDASIYTAPEGEMPRKRFPQVRVSIYLKNDLARTIR